MARQKSWKILAFMIVLGLVIGSAVGEAIGHVLPDGVVKNFFLEHAETGFGPTPLNFVAFTLTIGISLKVNIMAVLGVVLAAYLFRWY
jgi:hypothetical protein